VGLLEYPGKTINSFKWEGMIVPRCSQDTLSGTAPTNVDLAISDTNTQTMAAFTNALAGQYNNYCGLIEYELVGGNKDWIEFDPATRVILVKPTLNSHATSSSGITYTIKGKLTKFPTRLLTKTFNVIIRICP